MTCIRLSLAGLLTLVLACVALPGVTYAQSLGLGFGLSLPMMDYFTHDVGREYRVTPALDSGYFPVLRTLENAPGGIVFHVDFLIPVEDFGIIDAVELRFDASRMGWRRSRVTHVACTPVDVANGPFDDAIVRYYPLRSVDSSCLDVAAYSAMRDISGDGLSSLWFFHFSGGGRYHLWANHDWQIYVGAHLGVTLATTMDSDTWWGGHIAALFGVAYRLSPLVWVALDAKILFMVTQAPEHYQDRLNHVHQTGGNIFTTFVQPNAYADFQLSIRFDFNAF